MAASRNEAENRRKRREITPEQRARLKGLKTERKLKSALFYAFEALVDVLILFLFVRGFSLAFHFSHDVFYDTAMEPGNRKTAEVTLEDRDLTAENTAEKLTDAGVVKSKLVMQAKIRLGEYTEKLQAGTYTLSPSMKASEILNTICHLDQDDEEEEDSGTGSENEKASGTDAGKLHDNSGVGAGTGDEAGEEGAGGDEENGADSSGADIDGEEGTAGENGTGNGDSGADGTGEFGE